MVKKPKCLFAYVLAVPLASECQRALQPKLPSPSSLHRKCVSFFLCMEIHYFNSMQHRHSGSHEEGRIPQNWEDNQRLEKSQLSTLSVFCKNSQLGVKLQGANQIEMTSVCTFSISDFIC